LLLGEGNIITIEGIEFDEFGAEIEGDTLDISQAYENIRLATEEEINKLNSGG